MTSSTQQTKMPILLQQTDRCSWQGLINITKSGKKGLIVLLSTKRILLKELTKCLNVQKKLELNISSGFTGTLAENEEDKYKNLGILGPVRYEKTSKELRDEGFLSNVIVNTLELTGYRGQRHIKYLEEVEYLQMCEERNNFISKLLFSLDKNALVLVNYLAHGFELEKILNENNKKR